MAHAGTIIELASPEAVDRAWEAFAELARDIVDDPRLLTDRAFYQEYLRRQERFRKLFLVQEAGR